jgi:single-strand selective monofunctional uracil DNA glycosylase
MPEDLTAIAGELSREVETLFFGPPVSCVYNPLGYAWLPHAIYLNRYGGGSREIVLLGMNPGPWGMVQTGVPFGEVGLVRDWLGIEARVDAPPHRHPKRPVEGFACRRSEVSGRRVWGWARQRFGTPEAFFRRFFVANYCPLIFLEESGRNRTPDKLPKAEREPLFVVCDRALRRTVQKLRPRYVVGIGGFAAERAAAALAGLPVVTGGITHPSPANPKANKDWAGIIEQELAALGIEL